MTSFILIRIAVAQDLSVKDASPNQQGRFISAAVAAAGFGTVGHNLSHEEIEKENRHHHQEERDVEHEALGSHGHSHAHGHHGNYHGNHDHSHYEQIWNFSDI